MVDLDHLYGNKHLEVARGADDDLSVRDGEQLMSLFLRSLFC
jgi:hypothetical protein